VGDNVGILVKSVKREDTRRGFVLAAPNFIKAYSNFNAKIYILTKKEGGRHKCFITNYKPQFFFRTANITGTIILPENISVVMPGDSLIVEINLVEKAPINIGLRFVMREGNLTIGAGIITEI
jgi:elongation factor Tu